MNDVIVAISTTVGVGAIAIVRLTGNGSIELVSKIFKGKNLEKVDSHTINYGHIIDDDNIIDEVMVSIMKAPKTFTKEDVVEINCHGGVATTNKILELILKNGVRLAEPGEFTKRAFLNGRIDLIEAESVIDLINSKTEKARKVAINNLSGSLTDKIRVFRQHLLELIANIEVNIDYPEYEDIEVVTIDKIKEQIEYIKKEMKDIVKASEDGIVIKNGIKAVILGRPNVGKSSLLNKLIEEDKAIVTDIAGTTRDIVEGSIILSGIAINFIDTAGIRETTDVIEKVGVEKSLKEIKEADLAIFVLNNNEELTKEDEEILDRIKDIKTIIVINKKDLPKKVNLNRFDNKDIVYTTTLESDGINQLKDKIIEMFNLDELEQNDGILLTTIRQISLAKEALSILNNVEEAIDNDVPVDLVEIDIKKIWEKLGDIIGETYSEELINQLFSQFCLGK